MKQVDLTNSEIYQMLEVVNSFWNVKANFKFHYGLNKTKKNLERIVDKMPKYSPPTDPKYVEFLGVVQEKIKAEKIKFDSLDEISSFYEKELEAFPEAKKVREASLEEFRVILNKWEETVSTVKIYLIKEEHFPTEVDGEGANFLIQYFLEQEDEKKKK